jgi:hypothetical protein
MPPLSELEAFAPGAADLTARRLDVPDVAHARSRSEISKARVTLEGDTEALLCVSKKDL